ncbi:YciC family protein [Providencia hangzhouensis]
MTEQVASMFLLLVVCSLLIQLGITIMVLPGIVLAIGFSLAPAILMTENTNPFSAMGKKLEIGLCKLACRFTDDFNWMAVQMLISVLLGNLNMNHIAISGFLFNGTTL